MGAVGGLLAALAGGLVRKPRPPRPLAVPDVRGLFYPVCVEVARRHRLQVVRLTQRPMAVDGLVVNQDSPPGTVRRGGQLTVQICSPRQHARAVRLARRPIDALRGPFPHPGGRYALVTMCIGGGQGIAAVFERI